MAKKSKYKSKDKARQKRKRQQEKQRRANLILAKKREKENAQLSKQFKSSDTFQVSEKYEQQTFVQLEPTRATEPPKEVKLSDEFSVSDWYSEQDISQAYAQEELHEEVVILDNFLHLIDMLEGFDPSRVESSRPTIIQEKYALTEALKREIEDAINNWELRNRDGKKQVAKAINRVAPEIFDRTTRIMYKVYEMMNGGGKYDPSADIAFFVSAINFDDVDTYTIMSSEDIQF